MHALDFKRVLPDLFVHFLLPTSLTSIFRSSGIGSGLGVGMYTTLTDTSDARLFTPGVANTSTWFTNRRGAALGVVVCGSSIGSVIYPITLEKLLPQIGFGWTVRVVALIQLITLTIPLTVLKSRLPPRKMGPLIEPKAFSQKSYSLFTAAGFCMFWGLYGPYFYGTSYAQMINAPANLTPYVLAITNVELLCTPS